ncbi:hypothetical protein CALVIDRAFT_566045 [Calocera viscosa TUFC12733]|uniref:Uncharacterized protein n=1 Tax=Calocera viscosa (strain TUFC12733) TaxID=1330018 RepID=A0A167JZ42_CALVF|nr:hypothetical protein CALVIDRAFT_566045 [Calocera viscosa TUFC12733]
MGSDSVPLLESREPEDVKEWLGIMELWLEAKEVEAGKRVLKAQAGIHEPELVAWYRLDKATYQAMSLVTWSKELMQSSNQDVDTYLQELCSNNNRLDAASRLTDSVLCTIIKSGVKDDLCACLHLDATLQATSTLKELASGLAKLKEKHTQVTILPSTNNQTTANASRSSTPSASNNMVFAAKLTNLEQKYLAAFNGCNKCLKIKTGRTHPSCNFATLEEAKEVLCKVVEWDAWGQPPHKTGNVKVKVEAHTHASQKTKATKATSKKPKKVASSPSNSEESGTDISSDEYASAESDVYVNTDVATITVPFRVSHHSEEALIDSGCSALLISDHLATKLHLPHYHLPQSEPVEQALRDEEGRRHKLREYVELALFHTKSDFHTCKLCFKVAPLDVKDKFPLPKIDDILDLTGNATIWGKIDMTNSFFQT